MGGKPSQRAMRPGGGDCFVFSWTDGMERVAANILKRRQQVKRTLCKLLDLAYKLFPNSSPKLSPSRPGRGGGSREGGGGRPKKKERTLFFFGRPPPSHLQKPSKLRPFQTHGFATPQDKHNFDLLLLSNKDKQDKWSYQMKEQTSILINLRHMSKITAFSETL